MQKEKNVLKLIVCLILINSQICLGQNSEELFTQSCNLIDGSMYKLWHKTFPFSDEIQNEKTLESIFFPLILNGVLVSKSLTDYIGNPIEDTNLTEKINCQKTYFLPSDCNIRKIRKYPSKSKRFYSVKFSNPIIIKGNKRTVGFILIRSNSNNSELTPLIGILYKWNDNLWEEVIRKELEYHD